MQEQEEENVHFSSISGNEISSREASFPKTFPFPLRDQVKLHTYIFIRQSVGPDHMALSTEAMICFLLQGLSKYPINNHFS